MYLFVGGAPRSGTSALAELLSSHSDVALGMERYKFRYRDSVINKDDFTFDKFFNFSKEQTNIDDISGKYVEYYKDLKRKYKDCKIVGDKYPQSYKFFPKLFEEFSGDAKFIVIVRDVSDVASSFNVRAENPKDAWPVENDYKKAVEMWNEQLKRIKRYREMGYDMLTISYEKLYDSETYNTEIEKLRILDFLGIDDCDGFNSVFKKQCSDYLKKVKGKAKNIRKGQVDYIAENADDTLLKVLAI